MEGKECANRMDNILDNMGEMMKTLNQIEANGRELKDEVVHKRRTDGVKVYARVRCNIITVGDIDTLKEEFSCELALTIKWKEPTIKGIPADEIDWTQQWDPRLYFFNVVNIDKYEVKHRVGLKSPHDDEADPIPDCQLSIRIKGTFKSVMELSDFPFDYQSLTIKLMSDWPKKVVEFCKDMTHKDSIRYDTFTGGQEWELMHHVTAAPEKEENMKSGAVNAYPLYHITMNVRRKPSYYIWNVAMIMFLITPLAFTSFAVDYDAPQDRLSVTLTLLLTAVAFKFVVSQSLPNTSYQTLLDYYVLWCMVFLCLVVVQNAVVSVFSDPDDARIFDIASMSVLGGITAILNLIFLIIGYLKSRRVHNLMSEATKKYEDLCEEIRQGNDKTQNERRNITPQTALISMDTSGPSNPDPPPQRKHHATSNL